MTADRSTLAPDAQAARISAVAFSAAGAVMVIGGAVSILSGRPDAAHDLAPLAGPADLAERLGQVAPVLSAAVAAIVVAAVACLFALRRLAPVAASIELLILGLAIDACIGGAAGRIGHAVDGGVLGATVACLTGAVAVIAGGVIALLGRE
jgi:hypothetical protein